MLLYGTQCIAYATCCSNEFRRASRKAVCNPEIRLDKNKIKIEWSYIVYAVLYTPYSRLPYAVQSLLYTLYNLQCLL